MTSHELRILSVKSRKENLRLSREHELRIWDEAEKKKKTKKKKTEPRKSKSKSKSKWSNQKKTILPSDVEKQRAERARTRPIMRREKRKKENPEHSFRHREEWWEGKKKISEVRPWEWGIFNITERVSLSEAESCVAVTSESWYEVDQSDTFFFLYTQSLWYRTTWKSL